MPSLREVPPQQDHKPERIPRVLLERVWIQSDDVLKACRAGYPRHPLSHRELVHTPAKAPSWRTLLLPEALLRLQRRYSQHRQIMVSNVSHYRVKMKRALVKRALNQVRCSPNIATEHLEKLRVRFLLRRESLAALNWLGNSHLNGTLTQW